MMIGHQVALSSMKIGPLFRSYNLLTRWMSKHYKEFAEEKNSSTLKALSHFDEFYGSLFQENWPSMRVAMLSAEKKGVVLNNFSDKERVSQEIQNEGAYNVRVVYEEQQRILKDQISHEDIECSTDVYQVEGKIEDVFLRQQRIDFEEIYTEPLESIKNRVTSGQKLKEIIADDESPGSPEDPTKDQPLAESLKTADYDRCRIIHPGLSGSVTSASLYEFVPATKLKGMDDYIPESAHYSYYKNIMEAPINVEAENDIEFPMLLDVYAFERGNCDTFEHSKKGSTDVFDYHVLRLGSLAPVLALGMEKDDVVLDLTSFSLDVPVLISQSLIPRMFVANCENSSRGKYLLRTLNSYVFDAGEEGSNILVTDYHPQEIQGEFDKIIVSVPNTYDRRSVIFEEENVFNPARIKKRLKLPEEQTAYLKKALELVKVGGTVVYFTETLSPIQNDAVVQRALEEIWTSSNTSFTIKDLSKGLEPLQSFMKIAKSGKFGHLVIPFLPNNCGPLYFSKIVKNPCDAVDQK